MKKFSIIIPVYNEEATLRMLVEKVINVDISSEGYTKQLVFVNDGSKDSSEKIIHQIITDYPEIDIKYISNKKNSGKGFSLKEGFRHADGDVLMPQDADMEYFPEKDYVPMLKVFDAQKLDILYGSRTLGKKPFGNNYSSKTFLVGGLLVTWLTSVLLCKRVTDEPTCYKMFAQKLTPYLLLPEENGFEWEPAVTMLLIRKGFSYGEEPIHYHARHFDEGKKINRKDGLKALWTLVKWRFKKI